MDKLTLTTVHKQRIALIAFAAATLMLLDCIYQVAMHIRWQVWLPSTLVVEESTRQEADEESSDKQTEDVETQSSETQPNDAEASAEKPPDTEASGENPSGTEESVEKPSDTQASDEETKPNGDKPETPQESPIEAAITKRNIMAKPKPQKVELVGVLGKIALLKTPGGKTVGIEEGKSAKGIKVISIEGYQVTIEHHGKTETKKLFPEKDKPLAPSAASAPETDAKGKDDAGSEEAIPKTDSPKAAGEKVGQRSSLPSDRQETSNRNKGAN